MTDTIREAVATADFNTVDYACRYPECRHPQRCSERGCATVGPSRRRLSEAFREAGIAASNKEMGR